MMIAYVHALCLCVTSPGSHGTPRVGSLPSSIHRGVDVREGALMVCHQFVDFRATLPEVILSGRYFKNSSSGNNLPYQI